MFEKMINDWLNLTMLEAEKLGPALKNRLVGDAEMYKALFAENLWEPPMESSVSGTRRDSTSSKKLKVCSSGDFFFKQKQEETSRWSDGHVTAVHHERRAQTKQVSC